MTKKVNATWELERETAELDYTKHETFTLMLDGIFQYNPASSIDPGDCSLDLDRVTFRGSPFELTADEEAAIIAQWGEELRNGQ